MVRFTSILLICFAFGAFGAPASARAQEIAGCKASLTQNLKATQVTSDHFIFEGTPDAPVQIDCDTVQFFADHMELYRAEGRVIATGNVIYVSGGNRISAERMDFNTRTKLGTFYNAFGTAVLRDKPEPNLFGTQEPDAYFWGDELQKIGPKKYKIVHGGFTTCVQPTPRWDMRSGSITLNLDDYALLTNAIFRVKSVPLMYLPIFYYPIQEDDRATGFLIPVYGSSTTKGQSISNAFFWAISRSQDATLYHDWFSKTGQQLGGDYRYVLGPGSQGNARTSLLNEHEYVLGTTTRPAQKSYTIAGDLTQRLPHYFYARANADYFSSITSNQLTQHDVYQATRRNRSLQGSVTGNLREYSISGAVDRRDYFDGEKTFTTNGSLPRISFSRGERRIGNAPLYFGLNSEFVTIVRSTTSDGVKSNDQGLSKIDLTPSLRIPFTKWQFLTFNSSVVWRATRWSESLDSNNLQIPEPIGRRYFSFNSRITGPVFNRIWNTPDNGYAEKFKHVIEPTLTISRSTAFDNFARIPKLEGSDFETGDDTRYNYGVANRLYAKKGSSREILSATLSQSYHTDATATQFDRSVQSSFNPNPTVSHFTALVLMVRASPVDRLQADFRAEIDPTEHAMVTRAANGTYNGGSVQATAGWSQRRFVSTLPNFDNPLLATNYLNANATVHRPGSRFGGAYSFSYDLKQSHFLQQRMTAYYNAQCCGVGVEYQTFNLQGSFAGIPALQDHRFNLSFTLAGVGSFSNLFGAFGGQQNR